MVLPHSHRISRVLHYSGILFRFTRVSVTGLLPCLAGLSNPILLHLLLLLSRSETPLVFLPVVWALAISLATTLAIVVLLSFPPGT